MDSGDGAQNIEQSMGEDDDLEEERAGETTSHPDGGNLGDDGTPRGGREEHVLLVLGPVKGAL